MEEKISKNQNLINKMTTILPPPDRKIFSQTKILKKLIVNEKKCLIQQ